jgi:hypothetical protein
MILDTLDGIICRILKRRDIAAASELLAWSFCEREVLTPALGIGIDEMRRFAQVCCTRAAAEGLSIVGEDANGRIICCIIMSDLALESPPGSDAYTDRFAPILMLLDELVAWYLQGRSLERGDVLHLFMAAIDASYSGNRFGTRLFPLVFETGRRLGFKRLICEATGLASQTACRYGGMQALREANYADFEYEGQRPFASIRQPQGCVLFEKSLVNEKRLAADVARSSK